MAKKRPPVKMYANVNYNPYSNNYNIWFMTSALPGSVPKDYLNALRGVIRKDWEMISDVQQNPRQNPKPKPQVATRTAAIKLKWKVFKRDCMKCKGCGNDEELEVDHIKPISKGGSNKFNNLQTLCRRCNAHKHNKYNG